jgi:hypothetical protein
MYMGTIVRIEDEFGRSVLVHVKATKLKIGNLCSVYSICIWQGVGIRATSTSERIVVHVHPHSRNAKTV